MVDFSHKYQITLGHSTAYYPQGNGFVESSNKILVNIIKKLLEDNKKSWHNKLVHALWPDRLTNKKSIGMSPYQLVYGADAIFPTILGVLAMKLIQQVQSKENDMKVQENIKKLLEDNKKSWHIKLVHAIWANRLTSKKSIGMSPYQLVYGADAIFPTSLGVSLMKLIQEAQSEENDMLRRINQQVQQNIKKLFDKITKANDFNIGDKVLKWNSRREDKGMHRKFDNLWKGPYIIHSTRGNNAFFLLEMDGTELFEGPVNGRMLKHYFC